MDIKKKIKDRRARQGLTQAQLAEAIGVSQSTIGKYETGERIPSFEMLWAIDNALSGGVITESNTDRFFNLQDMLLEQLHVYIDDSADPFSLCVAEGKTLKLTQDDLEELDRITNSSIEYFEFEFEKFIKRLKARDE